ncbi:MAG: PEP/pyruvate-binding domain-containing protein [Patescibacteria group bacterium]
MIYIRKITKNYKYSSFNSFKTNKLEGIVTINQTGLPIADTYLIGPELYQKWKKDKKLAKTFQKQLERSCKNILKKFPSITLRTCFKFEGFENPRALPSWRNITSHREILKHISAAYKAGEQVARDNDISKFELGLLIMGRVNANKGGICVVDVENTKQCMIDACWGDAIYIANGEPGYDSFWTNDKNKIQEKTIRRQESGFFYKGIERKKIQISKKSQMQQSLNDKEVEQISKKAFKAAKFHKSNLEIEFMINANGRLEMYEIQVKPGFKLISSSSSPSHKDAILKGITAFNGQSAGQVRLITRQSDLKKIKTGEIAVVHPIMMRTVLPIVSKAAAIVTDSGGITSHLATVAKEFQVPCIVSAKNATKILKQEQKIFVDANSGEIFLRKPKSFLDKQSVSFITQINKAEDTNLVGGKAKNLQKISQLNYPSPNGLVITTTAFEYFLEKNKLDTLAKELVRNLRNQDKFEDLENKFEKKILEAKFPKNLKQEILQTIITLKNKYQHIAIRSSATCEDSKQASFAGQFESYLNIKTEKEILNAIKKVWISTYKFGPLLYAEKMNFNPSKIKMAVILQGMLKTKKAGVLFTQDIWQKQDSLVVIESHNGTGEIVVAGTKTPNRYKVNKKTSEVVEREIADKKGSLSRDEIQKLLDISNKLENQLKEAQDIEWAIENEKIYLLQTRPLSS